MGERENRDYPDSQGGQRKNAGISFPLILAFIGWFSLQFSAQFPDFVQRGKQLPGPRYFPTILGVFFLVAAAIELGRYIRWRRSVSGPPGPPLRDRVRALTTDWGVQSTVVFLVAMILFVPLIGTLGFLLGGFLFSFALMLRLKARWYSAIVVSLIVVITIALVFGRLLRVPLPAGLFGIAL